MDGKVLLLGFAGLIGAVFYLKGETFELPSGGGGGGGLGLQANMIGSKSPLDGKDRSDPNSYIKKQLGLDRAIGPVAATEHLQAAFIGKVLTEGHGNMPALQPASVALAEPHPACKFTPPAEGSRVVYITASDNKIDSPVFAYSDAEVRKQTERLLKQYRATGKTYFKVYSGSKQVKAFDVAVSDTNYPVHLVLETSRSILWNLHLKPGARVTGVSILGGRTVGVAGLDPSVPIEILDVERKKDCAISVQNRSLVNPVFLSSVESGVISQEEAEETLKDWEKVMIRYDRWFRSQFGLSPSQVVIGYNRGNVALVGPMPENAEELVPYQPLEAKHLVLASLDNVMIGSHKDYKTLMRNQIIELANEVTGGELDIVKLKEN